MTAGRQWHKEPAPISYVAVVMAISLVVGIITIVNWLFNPISTKLAVEIADRAREDSRLEKSLGDLNEILSRYKTQEDARWAGVPNVTSIEGELSTERAAREGFDAVSRGQREEALKRLDKVEERQTDVLQRLSALEALAHRFTLIDKKGAK